MSVDAISWAMRSRVGHPRLKVLLTALANYADREWQCSPSQRTLARDVEVTVRTINRSLDKLTKAGFITVEAQFGDDGGRKPSLIRLNKVAA